VYFFYSNFDIISLLWITIKSFHLLRLFIEFTGYFQKGASLPDKMRRHYWHARDRRHIGNFSSSLFISVAFYSAANCIQINEAENLNTAFLNFELC